MLITKIKKKIELFILQIILANYSKIVETNKRSNIISLKSFKNVSIHESFVMGNNCEFDVSGKIKQLSILENVYCRNFCIFLLYEDAELIINKNVFFNNYCSISTLGRVEIGENTLFGESVKIFDHNHKYRLVEGKLKVERSEFKIGKVKIGKNCWIGSNVTILNNVEIGDNVIVGANNLIYKSLPANTIVKAKCDLITEQLN